MRGCMLHMYFVPPIMNISSHCLIYILCLQVTPPESMTPRCYHSITATCLGPGLTEVLVFGGCREVLGDDIAETTILRFGEQLQLASIVC